MTPTDRPFFDPWIPSRFNGTLILAESCPKGDETQGITGWQAHPDSEWPQGFIIRHVQEKREQDDATFRSLRHSFLYEGEVLDTLEFWECHGFSNLIPRLMDNDSPKPTKNDAQSAREQLPLILQIVKPRRILIASAWAVEALESISDDKKYEKIGDNDCWQMSFRGIPALGIYHPAAWRWGYSLERARNATARLREIAE